MNKQYQDEITQAEAAVTICTMVFNQASEEYMDAAIYELLAAELRLKQLRLEASAQV